VLNSDRNYWRGFPYFGFAALHCCGMFGSRVCDGEGNILKMNEAPEKLNGLKAKNVIGENVAQCVATGVLDRSVTMEVLETVFFLSKNKVDAFVKSPSPSLRGAKRRGNLLAIRVLLRLPRFARNDKSDFLRCARISLVRLAD